MAGAEEGRASTHDLLNCDTLPVTVVHLSDGPVLCVLCEDKNKWLFPSARALLQSVPKAQIQNIRMEDHLDKALVLRAIWLAGSKWDATHLHIAADGENQCYQALGVGSNSECRKRAASLALAATVSAKTRSAISRGEAGDAQSFPSLVSLAAQLLASAQCSHSGASAARDAAGLGESAIVLWAPDRTPCLPGSETRRSDPELAADDGGKGSPCGPKLQFVRDLSDTASTDVTNVHEHV